MTSSAPEQSASGTAVVRYWAAARAAAGVETDTVEVGDGTTLAAVLRARPRAAGRPAELPDVIGVCSVLVGDRPVGAADPDDVPVRPGDTVELLPLSQAADNRPSGSGRPPVRASGRRRSGRIGPKRGTSPAVPAYGRADRSQPVVHQPSSGGPEEAAAGISYRCAPGGRRNGEHLS